MFRKLFQQLKFKMMARQLRRPKGAIGHKVGAMMNKANEFLYDFTLGLMAPAPQQHILEIGYGNGRFFEKIFSKAPGCTVAGIDYSETMCTEARAFNQQALEEGRLQLLCGNSDQLPFPDQSFDHIFCINVIYFWDQPEKHLTEIRRVLKPGGRFYATVRTKESMQQMPFTRYGFHFYEPAPWKAALQACGLRLMAEHPVDEPLIEFEGRTLRTQSLCAVAEKP